MKAVLIDHYGSAEVLQNKEIEQPQLKPDRLLVKVYATSVNPVDWKIRNGLLKGLISTKFPTIFWVYLEVRMPNLQPFPKKISRSNLQT